LTGDDRKEKKNYAGRGNSPYIHKEKRRHICSEEPWISTIIMYQQMHNKLYAFH